MVDEPFETDDPARLLLYGLVHDVLLAIRNGSESRDTLISLKDAVHRLDILLEKGSW